MKQQPEGVVVIGGGIAGLAAARELARGGRRVVLLEARARLGGRILTHTPLGGVVELGAEFVHGGNEDLRALLRRAEVKTKAVSRKMAVSRAGRLREDRGYWKETAEIMEQIPTKGRGSFAHFLKAQAERFPPAARRRARDYVESFNAAPATKISAAALRPGAGGAEQTQRRPEGGYGRLVRMLERELRALGVEIVTEAEVRWVAWSRGNVQVTSRVGRRKKLRVDRAAAVVVTLPLGVLKAKTVTFLPELKAKQRIIARLGWGEVARVTLQFREEFWREERVAAAEPLRAPGDFFFITSPGRAFPVWWMPAAGEALAVGWAGGPVARAVLRLSRAGQIAAALQALGETWGVPVRRVRAGLRAAWTHDWSGDPHARGAYSYPVAGFEDGPAQLAEPVAETVFFAGEATGEDLGTVHGALTTGIAAAKEILRGARRRRVSR